MINKMFKAIVAIAYMVIGTGMLLMVFSFLLALGPIGWVVAIALGGTFLRIARAKELE